MTVSSRGRRRLLPPVLEDEQAMAGLLARHTRAGCEAGPECHSRLALEAARQAVSGRSRHRVCGPCFGSIGSVNLAFPESLRFKKQQLSSDTRA